MIVCKYVMPPFLTPAGMKRHKCTCYEPDRTLSARINTTGESMMLQNSDQSRIMILVRTERLHESDCSDLGYWFYLFFESL